ncbi:MAG: PEP/pyruvate-binding domain-containing protein [Thermodesulfobacteriota bacterium]
MLIEAGKVVSDFDPHFKIFHELMPFKVQEILLVSSPYDAYIMEEDGSLATRLINEYQGLNLSGAPRITRVSSANEALDLVRRKRFDLVLTMPYLGQMDAYGLGAEIKRHHPHLPVILVTHNLRGVYPPPEGVDESAIDNVYLWCCESDLLMALVKNVEDSANVDADTGRAMVRVIIFVEDSPLYRSLFLPLIYKEVVRQTQSVLDESLNIKHRLLRMRARPKILSASTYEEAIALYKAYRPYVFGVISDARYSRNNRLDAKAGIRLFHYIREQVSDMPLLMLSSESENRADAEAIPAIFLDKNSPVIKNQLHHFFLNHLGFGDFVFRLPDETAIGYASNLLELEKTLATVPDESIRYHAENNHFSNWVMARAEVALATRLSKEHIGTIKKCSDLREDIIFKIHALRKLRQQGVVARFDSENYDPVIMDFVKIGNGSLGGKARGLAFMWARLQQARTRDTILSHVRVTIPKTCVISADGFDAFVAENTLQDLTLVSDESIGDIFLDCCLPDWLAEELRAFLERFSSPISVRSSSLLEDAKFRPYAGLYSTYFLANSHPDFEVRFQQLAKAVKLVYASTWFESPRAFSKIAGQGRDDSMAVIIQELVGRRYGDHWYPAISGVAQSHNYYPVGNLGADEGIAHIALGMGKTVVEGEKSLRFSPHHPKNLLQFSTVDDILANCQRGFYALDMSRPDHFSRDRSNLVYRQVQDAEREPPVQMLSSTYIAEEQRIRDAFLPGIRIMTFAQILKYGTYPLPEILSRFLELGRSGMGCEVEIEFAVRLHRDGIKSEFHLLQMRPMVTGGERVDVSICDEELEQAFCYSEQSLGHGRFESVEDIIYVKPENFDPALTRDIAMEIGELNHTLVDDERPYLLIGPGRWGSADPWLGIPVQWRDISGVGAMVELRNEVLRADASQGSHFFQNITSLGIPYLTVNEGAASAIDEKGRRSDYLNWQWVKKQHLITDKAYISHVRSKVPFIMKCNGKEANSVFYPAPLQDRSVS